MDGTTLTDTDLVAAWLTELASPLGPDNSDRIVALEAAATARGFDLITVANGLIAQTAPPRETPEQRRRRLEAERRQRQTQGPAGRGRRGGPPPPRGPGAEPRQPVGARGQQQFEEQHPRDAIGQFMQKDGRAKVTGDAVIHYEDGSTRRLHGEAGTIKEFITGPDGKPQVRIELPIREGPFAGQTYTATVDPQDLTVIKEKARLAPPFGGPEARRTTAEIDRRLAAERARAEAAGEGDGGGGGGGGGGSDSGGGGGGGGGGGETDAEKAAREAEDRRIDRQRAIEDANRQARQESRDVRREARQERQQARQEQRQEARQAQRRAPSELEMRAARANGWNPRTETYADWRQQRRDDMEQQARENGWDGRQPLAAFHKDRLEAYAKTKGWDPQTQSLRDWRIDRAMREGDFNPQRETFEEWSLRKAAQGGPRLDPDVFQAIRRGFNPRQETLSEYRQRRGEQRQETAQNRQDLQEELRRIERERRRAAQEARIAARRRAEDAAREAARRASGQSDTGSGNNPIPDPVYPVTADATFDQLHPRGHDGKFIEIAGMVRFLTGNHKNRRGKVVGIDVPKTGKPTIRVKLIDGRGQGGETVRVSPNELSQAPEKARIHVPPGVTPGSSVANITDVSLVKALRATNPRARNARYANPDRFNLLGEEAMRRWLDAAALEAKQRRRKSPAGHRSGLEALMTPSSAQFLAASLRASGLIAANPGFEALHPRGHDGKFIEKGGIVNILSGVYQEGLFGPKYDLKNKRGKVVGIVPGQHAITGRPDPSKTKIRVLLEDPINGEPRSTLLDPSQIEQAPEKARLDFKEPTYPEPSGTAPIVFGQNFPGEGEQPTAPETPEAAPEAVPPTEPPHVDEILPAEMSYDPASMSDDELDQFVLALNEMQQQGQEGPEFEQTRRDTLAEWTRRNGPQETAPAADLTTLSDDELDQAFTDATDPAARNQIANEMERRLMGGPAQPSSPSPTNPQATAKVVSGEPIPPPPFQPTDLEPIITGFAANPDPVDLTLVPPFDAMRGSGRPRAEMPQIPKQHLNTFQDRVKANGWALTADEVDPQSLSATQRELDGKSVGGMINSARAGSFDLTADPLWVSSDGHVLDGHHRWAAASAMSAACGGCPEARVPVVRVDAPMSALLPFADQFNNEMGVQRQAFGVPTPQTGPAVPAAPVPAAVAAGPPQPDADGYFTMATDAEDGITDEDFEGLPKGEVPDEPPAFPPPPGDVAAALRAAVMGLLRDRVHGPVTAAFFKRHRGGDFESLHPRGHDGQFIEKYGAVRIVGGPLKGQSGTVTDIEPKAVTVRLDKGGTGRVNARDLEQDPTKAKLTGEDLVRSVQQFVEQGRTPQDIAEMEATKQALARGELGDWQSSETRPDAFMHAEEVRTWVHESDESWQEYRRFGGTRARQGSALRSRVYGNADQGLLARVGIRWDPSLHPRGHDGQFIEVGGIVELLSGEHKRFLGGKPTPLKGKRAEVLGIIPDKRDPKNPTIRVKVHDPYTDDPHESEYTIDVKPDQIQQAPEKARLDSKAARVGQFGPDVEQQREQMQLESVTEPDLMRLLDDENTHQAALSELGRRRAVRDNAKAPEMMSDEELDTEEARLRGEGFQDDSPELRNIAQLRTQHAQAAERGRERRLAHTPSKPTAQMEVPSIGNVDDYIAAHPQNPGEPYFEWQARMVNGLSPDEKNALIFDTRERYPKVDFIAAGATRWRQEHGLPEPNIDVSEVPVPVAKADAVARAFEEAPDEANDPKVQAAFTEFKRQSQEMFEFMTAPEPQGLGITVDFWTNPDQTKFGVGPYPNATAQAEDLRQNHHISIEHALGGAHQLTMSTEEYDRFRAVHDVFGHAGIGGGFDRHGEYQAYLEHASMYTGDGFRGMASEYHGVNTALWSGEPGTPGTGKSILLPEDLIPNPWGADGSLITAAATPEQITAMKVTPDTYDALVYLADQAGIDQTFGQYFEQSQFHMDLPPNPAASITTAPAAEAVAQVAALRVRVHPLACVR